MEVHELTATGRVVSYLDTGSQRFARIKLRSGGGQI